MSVRQCGADDLREDRRLEKSILVVDSPIKVHTPEAIGVIRAQYIDSGIIFEGYLQLCFLGWLTEIGLCKILEICPCNTLSLTVGRTDVSKLGFVQTAFKTSEYEVINECNCFTCSAVSVNCGKPLLTVM
jgi:hypothetical protein